VFSIYHFEKIIGKGGFGTVKQASLVCNPNGKKYAIKVVSKKRIKGKRHLLFRELYNLKNLDHPNIIKFYEIYENNDNYYIC
jgi:calcium-dependent protein kinase